MTRADKWTMVVIAVLFVGLIAFLFVSPRDFKIAPIENSTTINGTSSVEFPILPILIFLLPLLLGISVTIALWSAKGSLAGVISFAIFFLLAGSFYILAFFYFPSLLPF